MYSHTHCTWYWPHNTFKTYYIHLMFTVWILVWSELNFIFFLFIWYELYPIGCDLNHNWKRAHWFDLVWTVFDLVCSELNLVLIPSSDYFFPVLTLNSSTFTEPTRIVHQIEWSTQNITKMSQSTCRNHFLN